MPFLGEAKGQQGAEPGASHEQMASEVCLFGRPAKEYRKRPVPIADRVKTAVQHLMVKEGAQ